MKDLLPWGPAVDGAETQVTEGSSTSWAEPQASSWNWLGETGPGAEGGRAVQGFDGRKFVEEEERRWKQEMKARGRR